MNFNPNSAIKYFAYPQSRLSLLIFIIYEIGIKAIYGSTQKQKMKEGKKEQRNAYWWSHLFFYSAMHSIPILNRISSENIWIYFHNLGEGPSGKIMVDFSESVWLLTPGEWHSWDTHTRTHKRHKNRNHLQSIGGWMGEKELDLMSSRSSWWSVLVTKCH